MAGFFWYPFAQPPAQDPTYRVWGNIKPDYSHKPAGPTDPHFYRKPPVRGARQECGYRYRHCPTALGHRRGRSLLAGSPRLESQSIGSSALRIRERCHGAGDIDLSPQEPPEAHREQGEHNNRAARHSPVRIRRLSTRLARQEPAPPIVAMSPFLSPFRYLYQEGQLSSKK